MKRRQFKQVALTVIITLAWTLNLFACSCFGVETTPISVKHSDVVFSGQVISQTLTYDYDSLGITILGDTSKMLVNWRLIPHH